MHMENNVDTQIFRALMKEDKGDTAKVQPHALSFFAEVSQHISASTTIEDDYKIRIQQRIAALSSESLNILMVGAENVGKSTTLSALFGEHDWTNDAPNKSMIVRNDLAQLTLWEARLPSDSDNPQQATNELGSLLSESDEQGRPLVDLVLVVLDATSNNLESCYRDISDTLVPMLGRQTENRLMVLMNKADKVAQNIRGTASNQLMPLDAEIWLDCTAATIRYRLIHNTGVQTRPIAYSALAGDSPANRPYNLMKVVARMMVTLPEEKRLLLLNQPFTQGDDYWRDHDDRLLYLQSVENLCFDNLHLGARDGDRFGGQLGAFLGRNGRALGEIVCDALRKQFGISL
ncbi:GTPase family protein [Enterovibrio coralii]|uniref:G domain-containing protein n=1 Tax=Enterovibrio coralii TaxID=294935 RepID=A0A135IAY7_9GAMM|nr:hypothetical protein [Enterovibrio coralii]KXF82626.1 hypothetical protein ATN88_21430 [Enterovibrio coralii]